ncbi:MAG: histidinol-phosphate transaminase [Oscillospiraceae bacterium]|nr:histidinol-phosphate transaminase [Oscillospiraceae bacterium]
MAYTLPDKIKNMTPYDPVSGEYPVRLDANESFFSLDELPELSSLLQQALRQPLNRYPDPAAAGPCRAFSALYGVPERCLTAGNGSDELISLICGSLLPKGAKLLTFAEDFSMYRFYGEICELQNVTISKGDGLTIDVDALLKTIAREKADALIFSNPCNPTSLLLGREGMLRLLREAPCLIVADEAYMEFCSESQSVLDMVERCGNLIVLKTCSKAIGLAGIRLGFAAAGEEITRALRAAKSPYNVNALTQAVGQAVLSRPDVLQKCRDAIVASRRALQRGLEERFGSCQAVETIYPSETNFVYMKVKDAAGAYEALKQRGIIIRCMGSFLRITAGTEEENGRLLAALNEIWREQP